MDVLRPSLLWIDGRCYRQNVEKDSVACSMRFDYGETENTKSGNMSSACIETDETCDDDCSVVMKKSGSFVTELHVPSALNGIVLGAKGVTKMRIESDTRTKITVPRYGVEGHPIVITGKERGCVIKARCRILDMTTAARQRYSPTHFLSIPLTAAPIPEGLARFKEEVLEACKEDRGIEASLFQNPLKFHLTIGVLVLLDEAERQRACAVLNDCVDKIIRPTLGKDPLEVDIKGIEYMNDDPREINVIYAKVVVRKNPERLQILADQLVQHYVDAGIMNRQYDNVKLHATVLNTQFAAKAEKIEKSEKRTFDGRRLLELFKDFNFGTVTISSLHLSLRFSHGKDGYYLPSKVIEL